MKRFFRKFFNRDEERTVDIPTRPISGDERSRESVKALSDPPNLLVGCAQSIGRQRDHNEDALFALTTTLTSELGNMPFGLYIVADGMGGHQHGEVASGIAVRMMANYIFKKLYASYLSLSPKSPQESLQEIMQAGVQDAHRSITQQVPGGGTTLTAALILGHQLILAHVGDSRAYHIGSNGKIESLTRDHSLVKRLVELGQLTTDEAAIHPQRNVLYRALGQGEPFDPDINATPLPETGHLLLCSDGLWGVLSEAQIHRLVIGAPNPQEACQRLVDAANEAGGPDNITAILIRLPG